eukprot:TRINITY_DN5407_c0_g1_i2.p1 TRINITY_DN5407_c0_g1~~TRINITY_DN5407_c0_g1_i2.p1  ORF type:complete len:365 (+),score=84.55 TRINITY_DN5407_c0_g1_i2:100-1194(+)
MESAPKWLPPGADCNVSQAALFGLDLEEHFELPERLADKSASLVEAVNDFHFAMLNDKPRNEFYRKALKEHVKEGDIVLEIGTGSGLLAMLAAKAGAKKVYAIEANRHMAQSARQLIAVNGLSDKIEVINALSTDVELGKQLPEKADVLVSEILGTLLLGESALEYVSDVRDRLLKPNAKIIPSGGAQYVSLIQSDEIKSITSVESWEDIDLRGFNSLKDTVSVVFTKQYGFRFSSTKHEILAGKTRVVDVDFSRHGCGDLPLESRYRITIEKDGRIDAALTYWEAYGGPDHSLVMSTDPKDTIDNFARDMQWGQALQLMDDSEQDGPGPHPFLVKQGEVLDLVVRLSEDSAVIQFALERVASA